VPEHGASGFSFPPQERAANFLRCCFFSATFLPTLRTQPVPIIPFGGRTPKIDPTAFIAPTAVVLGDVEIGEHSSVWYGAVLRGDLDPIRIGARTNVQDNAVLHTGKGEPCVIGDDVTIGHTAIVHGCEVQKGALIGMGAVVLNRAVIGPECIVGAHALVTEDKVFAARQLILGSPAKAIRELTEGDLAPNRTFAQRYIENARRHREALNDYAVDDLPV
jgi:carbonic anhydrase/acetyltransferase-like protein (isoleucine patch superfamily)